MKTDLSHLKNNDLYTDYKNYNLCSGFESFLFSIMVLKENKTEFPSLLHFVKDSRSICGIGIYYMKEYSNAMRDLGFIIVSDKKTHIQDGINYINSGKNIIDMIDNNINYVQFIRLHKIRSIQHKIYA